MLQLYKNNFNAAKNLNNFKISEIVYSSFIQQLPNETWFQKTYLKENIAFAGNLKAELVDFNEVLVLNITDEFYFNEFTDEFGIKQINFEFGNFNLDFYTKQLYLKLSHTQSSSIWYSNGFYITNYQANLTERFDYRNDKDDYFQSIRYKIYKNDFDVKSEIKTYTQTSGNIISLKPIETEITKLRMDLCDNFYFIKLLQILKNDLLYLSNYKISDKPQIKKGERLGTSNIFILDSEINLTNIFQDFSFQIYKPYQITPISPIENYTVNELLPQIKAGFNRLTTLGNGDLQLYNASNQLIQSFSQNTMSIVNNVLFINTNLIPLALGNYYFKFGLGLFNFGQQTLQIDNSTKWKFSIINGDYDQSDYDSNDYLI